MSHSRLDVSCGTRICNEYSRNPEMEVPLKKHKCRVQEVMTKFNAFEQGKSRSVIGLGKQLAATITACRTGGLDKIQYHPGHALQLLRFSSPPPGGTRVRLASPSPMALFNIHGLPSLAANFSPPYMVLGGGYSPK